MPRVGPSRARGRRGVDPPVQAVPGWTGGSEGRYRARTSDPQHVDRVERGPQPLWNGLSRGVAGRSAVLRLGRIRIDFGRFGR